MKTIELTHYVKSAVSTFVFLMILSIGLAGGNIEAKSNLLSYDLGKAKVNIEFDNQSADVSTKIQAAIFSFNKNMTINGTHINKGVYDVTLRESQLGTTLIFYSNAKKEENVSLLLESIDAADSDYMNYSLEQIEEDKLKVEIAYKGVKYAFTMELALSNIIFSHLNKEEYENTSDWLDYYQAGIYAYKNNIDLEKSFKYAERALKEGQNEYTIELSLLYLEALGRNYEAQQLSALHD